MSIAEDVDEIVMALEKKGYKVSVEQRGYTFTLTVSKGDLKAHVLIQGKPTAVEKLLLNFSDKPGLTVLRCEEPDRVKNCIKKLLEALKG